MFNELLIITIKKKSIHMYINQFLKKNQFRARARACVCVNYVSEYSQYIDDFPLLRTASISLGHCNNLPTSL